MALRRNTVLGSMSDAIAYAAAKPGDGAPLLAVLRAIAQKVEIVNFEIPPSLGRLTGMLRTGGALTVRIASVARIKDRLCLQCTIPTNFRDYEILYFGGQKPDGGVAVRAIRSRDVKSAGRMVIPLDDL